jgi:hypothetical protein
MAIGDTMAFKHIPFNVKIQYPFNRAHVGMLVGGTGITPMIQVSYCVSCHGALLLMACHAAASRR